MPTKIDQIKKQINAKLEMELAKQLRDIPKLVETCVQTAVLKILGICRNGTNGFEPDNWGKNSLNDYINDQVQTAMKTHVAPIINKEYKRVLKYVTLPRNIGKKIAADAEYTFAREFKSQMDGKFEQLGRKFADKIGKELDEMVGDIGVINTDLFDPDSYEGKLGEMLLEQIAEKLAK